MIIVIIEAEIESLSARYLEYETLAKHISPLRTVGSYFLIFNGLLLSILNF